MSKIKKLWRWLLRILAGAILISILSVVLFRFVPVLVTPLMLIRNIEQLQQDKPLKLEKKWVSLDNISRNLQLAVICAEDQQFLNHHGFDFEAIEKAFKNNKKGRRIKGASTISQQTAKNLFLWPGRSWLRKGLETYFTVLIELLWPKERIMEVYLNIIEFGDGIYGAEAAARAHFSTTAVQLNRGQSALLAAVLPNPMKYNARTPGPYVRSRQAWVLGQMALWGHRLEYPSEKKEKP